MKTQLPELPAPVVIVVGPTASGKTDLSIHLAEAFEGEVVSIDSRLFYRGMDIGTAKPSKADLARVRHHLIDVAEPDEAWSLAVFQRETERVIAEVHQRGNLPFLVGGTGQYVRATVEGWTPPELPPNPTLRSILQDWADQIGPYPLHERLAILDPAAAAQIDPRNLRRTIRALEVIFMTGYKFSAQRQRKASIYSTLMIGLKWPRAELFDRIDRRIEKMVADGFLEEVKALLDKGYSPDLPSFSAIGYREMALVIDNKLSLEEAIVQMKRATHHFVRRQANWFKPDDPSIHWLDPTTNYLQTATEWICDPRMWKSADRQLSHAPQDFAG